MNWLARLFKPKPKGRAYLLHCHGYELKTVTAADASAAAEAAFPCATGLVSVRVLVTGEKFMLERRSQLDRWEFTDRKADPTPAELVAELAGTATQPRPLPTSIPRPGRPSTVLR